MLFEYLLVAIDFPNVLSGYHSAKLQKLGGLVFDEKSRLLFLPPSLDFYTEFDFKNVLVVNQTDFAKAVTLTWSLPHICSEIASPTPITKSLGQLLNIYLQLLLPSALYASLS
ncbi:hypothetical protein ACTXT7_007296 [Hymenolepis weldensis]